MKLKDYTIAEYKKLKNTTKIDVILNFVEPINFFFGKQMNIGLMPYSNVRHCFNIVSNQMNWKNCEELFEICFDVKDFEKATMSEFFKARNFLIKEFKSTIEKENKLLNSEFNDDSYKWQEAGIERLKPYNDVISLDRLAQRYNIYPFDLGRKPYNEVLYLMAMVKVDNEINVAFSKIK